MAKFLCGGSPQDYTMFANVEDGATSSQAYVAGEYVVRNKVLREVIAPIAQGDTITVGTNLSSTGTNVGEELSELNSSLTENLINKPKVNFGANNYFEAQVRNGVLIVNCNATSTTTANSWVTVATLPDGYRPAFSVYGMGIAISTHLAVGVYITVNGEIKVNVSSSAAGGTLVFSISCVSA